jgi:ribose transport system ATP-binding protein
MQLVAERVSMVFAGQRALDDVDVSLERGEIHAVLGANGSGKSTLIKILAGYHTPESGSSIRVGGEPLSFGSARASHSAGLRFIHQDLGLVDTLDVAENLKLGRGYQRKAWLSTRQERAEARAVLRRYGLDIDPSSPVGALSAAQKSMVAIIRAVEGGVANDGVLVLDEPTASLPPEEVHHLMRLLMELRAQGVTILYVTHRLPEVFEIADRVTVLRDGRRVATKRVHGLTEDDLVELILGKRLEKISHRSGVTDKSPVLEVTELSGDNVVDFSFAARPGELLGITGLLGSGYESILGLVFGSSKRTAGDVRLNGQVVSAGSPRRSIARGIGYSPADRRNLGGFLGWSVRENLTVPRLSYSRRTGRLSRRAETQEARTWIQRLDIKPDKEDAALSDLSGGNQQKVVVGRMLRCQPAALLLDEPTIGVDAGAKTAIYAELREVAMAGAAVVVSSSDTEELSELCDRVLVVAAGRLAGELVGTHTPAEIADAAMRAEQARHQRPNSPPEHLTGRHRDAHDQESADKQ